jgi:LPS sulfotransferase NodH
MQNILQRYVAQGQVGLINPVTLTLYRHSPHIAREWGAYGLRILRRRQLPAKKFVIFAQGRSGSTLLVDLLNSHPEVFSYGELLQQDVVTNVRSPRHFVEGLLTLSRRPACGFKVKVSQLSGAQGHDPGQVLADFERNGWKLIHLKRSNILKHAISSIRAEKTGLFHNVGGAGAGRPASAAIRIDVGELIENLKARQRQAAAERQALASLPHLVVEYENDLVGAENQQCALHRIFEYVGVHPHKVNTVFRKVTAERLEDGVSNFVELEEALRNTEYGAYLD